MDRAFSGGKSKVFDPRSQDIFEVQTKVVANFAASSVGSCRVKQELLLPEAKRQFVQPLSPFE